MTAARSVIFGCESTTLHPDEAAFFRESDPWGFILFARNVDTPAQLRKLTGDLREAVGRDAPVLVDQEGGRVARLRGPHWRDWCPVADEAVRAGTEARLSEVLRLRYRIIAAELHDVGIDVNCVPVLDLPRDGANPVIGNRALGRTHEEIACRGSAIAAGLISGGVLPVIKHMPGHGAADADSHLALPVADVSAAELQRRDFVPFSALSELPLGMTAHVLYPALDADTCATESPRIHKMIREEIGYDGLLMTDDLSMSALHGTVAERAIRALAAGCDMILHCNGEMSDMTAIAAACPMMTEAAVARAQRAEIARGSPDDEDVAGLVDHYTQLTETTAYA